MPSKWFSFNILPKRLGSKQRWNAHFPPSSKPTPLAITFHFPGMADPLTALGAAAAAAQLANQAYSLVKFFSDLHGKLKEAPELTQARVAHIEQLQSVSNLIQKTKALQTDEVQAILAACLQTTADLSEILKKYTSVQRSSLKRALKTVKIVHKEDRVIVLLDRIEKQKSLLALCIHQLDA